MPPLHYLTTPLSCLATTATHRHTQLPFEQMFRYHVTYEQRTTERCRES